VNEPSAANTASTLDRCRARVRTSDGVTLIETLFVAALVVTLTAMVVPVSNRFIVSAKGDSTIAAAVTALETAKSRAVAERRNFRLTFTNPNHLVVDRIEVPSGAATRIGDYMLEGGREFVKFSIPDTPDRFGNAAAVAFSGYAPVMFTSDGSLIDSNGDVINGTIFIGVPNQPETARAITVFGVTGLMRTWKWRGNSWLE
jgi:type II secretory pathway pseudopilin PulG